MQNLPPGSVGSLFSGSSCLPSRRRPMLTTAQVNQVRKGDASSLLLGLQAHHGSGLSSGWTLLGALVAAEVAAL